MNFQVHNGARDTTTRTQRAERPTHGGLKQFIMNGQRRLVRGRPVQISLDQLKQYIEEFRTKEKQGILYVTTMDGRVVDLYDDRLPAAPSVPPQNPRPEPPLDSANNDTPTGHNMNVHPREAAPPKSFTMPVEPPVAATDNPLEPTAPAETGGDPAPSLLELADGAEPPVAPPAAETTDAPVEGDVPATEPSAAETAEVPAVVGAEEPATDQPAAPAEEKSSEAKGSSKKDKSKKNR